MATQEAKLIVKMEADTRRLQTKLDQAGKKIKRFEKQAKRSTKAVSASFKALAGVAILGAGFALAVRGLTRYSDEYTNLNNRLRLASKSSEDFAKSQGLVFSIAQDTRQSLSATAELYQRLALSTRELNLGQSELAGVVTTVNQSLVISGASTQAAASAIVQLGQGLAAGALRGQEFNSIAEQAPRLMQALADSLDVNIGKLREYSKDGILTSELIVKALKGQAAVIADEFSKTELTVSQSLQRIQNSFTKLFGEGLKGAGATKDLTDALAEFNTLINDPALGEALTGLAAAVIKVAAGFVVLLANTHDFFKGIGENFAKFVGGAADVAGVLDDLESRFASNRFSGGFDQESFNNDSNFIKQLSGFETVEEIEKNLNKVKSLILEVGKVRDQAIGTKRDKEVIDKQFLGLLDIEADLEAALAKAPSLKPPKIAEISPTAKTIDLGDGGADKKIKRALADVKRLLDSIRSPMQEYTDNVAVLGSLLKAGKLGQDDYNLALAEYQKRLDEATPGIQNLVELSAAVTDALPAEEKALAAVRQKMLDLTFAMEQFPEKTEAIIEALKDLQAEEVRLVEKSKETDDKLSEFGKEAARNIQNELGDTLRSSLEGDFDGILESWGNMLAEMGIQLVAQNFADAFNLEDLFKSDGSKGGGLSSFFGGFFAAGGRPGVGKLNVVGERGPELFVPDAAGTIIPNDALGGGQSFSFGDVVLQGVTNEEQATKAAGKFMSETARLMNNAQRYT